MKRLVSFLRLSVILLGVFSIRLSAQWSADPNINNPIAVDSSNQSSPQMISDGAGGSFIVWSDTRRLWFWDIYVQHINGAGYAQWPANGLLVSQGTVSAETTQIFIDQQPRIISDGAGGIIVVWNDFRNSINGIFAQRINGAGMIQWALNGIPVSSEMHDKLLAAVVPDGNGGAIISWHDARDTVTTVYAQKLNASGIAQWASNDVLISTGTYSENILGMVSDDAGGAILVLTNNQTGTYGIYGQRIDGQGNLLWQTGGVPISVEPHDKLNPAITSDGTGGAIIAWEDNRGFNNAIYAQRISKSGTPQWLQDGILVSAADAMQTYAQAYPNITLTNTGVSVITWLDSRRGFLNYDIFAQMVDASGSPLWEVGGIPVDTLTNNQISPAKSSIISDQVGGAILTWKDYRSGGNFDIYAQRIDEKGKALWRMNGTLVSGAVNDQYDPILCTDERGGAIIAWSDNRNDNLGADIYMQKFDDNGIPGNANPIVIAARDIANDQGGKMRVMWTRSSLDVAPKTVIHSYTIKLGVKNAKILGKNSSTGPSVPDPIFWQTVGSQPADWSTGYSAVVQTYADSGLQGIPMYYFQIIAISDSNIFWKSNIDSGYSIDNVSPVGITGTTISGGQNSLVHLQWNKDIVDPDIMGYYVYRSTTTGFLPDGTTLLALTSENFYSDTSKLNNQKYYYRVAAVDIHGNAGPASTELQVTVTGVADNEILPKQFTLLQNYPNPFNPSTEIQYQLPVKDFVSLNVYDALGREVATLVNEVKEAGYYSATFDASKLSTGIYLAKLQSGDKVQMKKMMLLK